MVIIKLFSAKDEVLMMVNFRGFRIFNPNPEGLGGAVVAVVPS
jgi:hypothetical protein